MCAVSHDGGRNDGESAGAENNKHDHGVGCLGFVCVECLEFAHDFESHRGGGIVKAEHVGGEVHEHGAVDGVVVGYLGEDSSEERCDAAREGVDYSALLADVEDSHPEGEYAS